MIYKMIIMAHKRSLEKQVCQVTRRVETRASYTDHQETSDMC